MSDWRNVSKSEVCPICGHDSWCSLSNDGIVCVCRRTPSERPTKSGNGWIHFLKERSAPVAEGPRRYGSVPPSALASGVSTEVDVDAYFGKLSTGNDQVRLSRHLMRELSLPSELFLALDVRWDKEKRAAAFPMRDGEGKIVGIRYRQLKTGRKWALKGGHDGIFFIPEMLNATGDELFVCEGPTDLLAAVACGRINAVARSSCMTGLNHLRTLIRRYRYNTVTIAADRDEPKTRPDGSTWLPGQEGAAKLANDLGIATRIILPPEVSAPNDTRIKDLRDWYAFGGMTEDWLTQVVESAPWKIADLGIKHELLAEVSA